MKSYSDSVQTPEQTKAALNDVLTVIETKSHARFMVLSTLITVDLAVNVFNLVKHLI